MKSTYVEERERGIPPARPQERLLTLIVPVYNEQHAIGPFLDAARAALALLDARFETEILFVNDGSRDGTEFVLRSYMQKDERIRLINLSRNFGKEAALCAGMDHARGDAVIPVDVDLQDDVSIIPEMIEKWELGAQIVNAKRRDRSSDSWLKRVTARGFYRVFNALSDQPMPSDVGDFRLLDRQVVDIIRSLGEKVRLNKALFAWVGFDSDEVTYQRNCRRAGKTSMGYWKLWNMALDGIFASSTKPLRVWTYVGSALAFASFLYAAWIFLRTLVFGVDVPGYASTLVLILMFGGVQLFAIGILGEYVGRILTGVRERPLYIVRSSHPGEGTRPAGARPHGI